MGNTLIILLGYILNFILIIVIISLLLRIRNIERKLVNFTPTEAYTIMENMREMMIDCERLADTLEGTIKQREAVLEDLSDLVDEKIARLDKVLTNGSTRQAQNNGTAGSSTIKEPTEKDIKASIISMNSQGKSDADIARALGISITEVRLALSLLKKD